MSAQTLKSLSAPLYPDWLKKEFYPGRTICPGAVFGTLDLQTRSLADLRLQTAMILRAPMSFLFSNEPELPYAVTLGEVSRIEYVLDYEEGVMDSYKNHQGVLVYSTGPDGTRPLFHTLTATLKHEDSDGHKLTEHVLDRCLVPEDVIKDVMQYGVGQGRCRMVVGRESDGRDGLLGEWRLALQETEW